MRTTAAGTAAGRGGYETGDSHIVPHSIDVTQLVEDMATIQSTSTGTARATPQALLRRKSTIGFETDAPGILYSLLRAQGWTLLSIGGRDRMTHMLAEHLDYGEARIYASGLVLGQGDQVLTFLASLVEWCGGRDE